MAPPLIRVRALRPVIWLGRVAATGEVLNLPPDKFDELLAAGYVERADHVASPAVERAEPVNGTAWCQPTTRHP